MTKEDIKNYISAVDIKEIAAECNITVGAVRKALNGKSKKSVCIKYIIARIKRNKELEF
jgi:predicted transcriptional regulator